MAALPFGAEIGIAVSAAGSLAVFALVLFSSPKISVTNELVAGRMRIPLSVIGATEVLGGQKLKEILGPGADARAQLFIRGYLKTALKIEIKDPLDPTPYLIVSTRRPEQLAVALLADRP